MVHTRRQRRRTPARAEPLERRRLLSAAAMRAFPAHQDLTAAPAFATGANGPYGFTPAQVRAAYGFDAIRFNGVVGDGTGQTIAVVVAYDNPDLVSSTSGTFAASDLHRFDQQFGLADPPSFTKVDQNGSGTSLPGTDPTGGWEDESAVDVEWAHAAAPGASILLVECYSDGLDDLITGGVNYARQQPGVSVVSMSFAAPESATELTYDPYLTTPAGHAGVTFLAASGDAGTPAEYPAASPTVIGVGGTTAELAGDIYSSETGLSNGGGGVSLYEPKPVYQAGLTQSATNRLTPDVAFEANHLTNGNDVCDSYNGGAATPWFSVGGTSFATPMWAGLIATADQGRAQLGLRPLNAGNSALPRIYYLPQTDFHDVTSGNNGAAAGTGYDLVTGRGTPIANQLVPDLAGGATLSGTVYADADGNGSKASSEGGIAGAEVYLDLAHAGTVGGIDPATFSTAGGAFAFNDLPGGTYTLAALPFTSYRPTTATYTVTLGYGAVTTGKLIGQQHVTGGISGHVFEDLNLSRTRTASSPAYGGWTVFLDNNNDALYDAGDVLTTANASGYYQFTGLSLGATYHVFQVVPPGYSRTTLGGGVAANVFLTGTALKTLDFGYVPNTSAITGNVYQDTNDNAARDAGEPPLYGVAIYLDLDHNGSYSQGVDVYVLTDPAGNYSFTGLAPGTYFLNEVIFAGYRRTNGATTDVAVPVGVAATATQGFANPLA